MNLCIISGSVASEIKYDFLYESKKNIAIANFKFKMENSNYIDVYALDDVADKIYAKLKNGEHILIEGRIRDNGRIEVSTIW